MASWEDYVNDVCVLGRPGQMRGLAADWEALFYNADTVAAELKNVMQHLEQTFTGPGGDAYRKHLDSIKKTIEKIRDDHSGIVHSLREAAEHLDEAQQQMPVPDYMMDNVNNRRADLDQLNNAGARAVVGGALAIPTFGLSFGGAMFAPDSFMKPLADSFIGDWGREFYGHFTSWWDDWSGEKTDEAKKWYDKVNQENLQTALATPDPQKATPGYDYHDPYQNLDTGPGGGPTGHVPGLGSPGLHPGASGITPSTHGFGGTGTDGLSGSYQPSSGLSGAGGSGLSGLGGGAGGLGAGGLGSTAGGLGGLGSGPPVGMPVTPTGMPTGGLGGLGGMPMGAGAGRGGGRGSGSRGGRGGPAGMAGGHGGRGDGDGDERYTWLHEDEDVWGGGTGAQSGTIS